LVLSIHIDVHIPCLSHNMSETKSNKRQTSTTSCVEWNWFYNDNFWKNTTKKLFFLNVIEYLRWTHFPTWFEASTDLKFSRTIRYLKCAWKISDIYKNKAHVQQRFRYHNQYFREDSTHPKMNSSPLQFTVI
jgi:hypothetical protein